MRELLQIKDPEPDERLRNLARARRTTRVSFNSHIEEVTLPPVEYVTKWFSNT